MWDETKRQRFNTLRIREKQGVLTAEEQSELESLYRDIEAAEAAYLGPATERRRQETEKLRAINEALRDVIRRFIPGQLPCRAKARPTVRCPR